MEAEECKEAACTKTQTIIGNTHSVLFFLERMASRQPNERLLQTNLQKQCQSNGASRGNLRWVRRIFCFGAVHCAKLLRALVLLVFVSLHDDDMRCSTNIHSSCLTTHNARRFLTCIQANTLLQYKDHALCLLVRCVFIGDKRMFLTMGRHWHAGSDN